MRPTDEHTAGVEEAEVARTAPAAGDREGDAGAKLVPVDPEPAPRTIYARAHGIREHDRRPIIPAYLRSRHEAAQLGRWLARHGLHVIGYHLTRAPLYALRLAWRAPLGAWVAVLAVAGWVFDREGAPLRLGAVARGDTREYMTLSNQRNRRVRQRGVIVAGLVLLGVLLLVLLWWLGTPGTAEVPGPGGRPVTVEAPAPAWTGWAQLLLLAAAVVALGKAGTPSDRRVTDAATVSPAAPPRLTAEVVTRALHALGIAAMSPKTGPISYVAPIARDGPGWRADLDLPHGVTVADVMERRDRLASGLRRPLSAVWPEPSAEQHAGRLILWVGDQPLNRVKPAAWPLVKAGTVDVLGGEFPFGTDQRQRPVRMSLAETNALIGSLPGGGKTAAVRVLALAAALDPHAELRIFEHKGSGDLDALEQVAHRYVSGVSDDAIAETLASLREVHAELERRAAILGELPRDLVPDRKVTPELARRRSSGLHPLVLVVDEAQEVFAHGDHGKEAGELAERIIKRGRALGVVLVLATQRPDSKSLPTGVSTNVGVRFCLRVMDQTANDMVLGTSAYKNGIRATTFTPRDKGIGYLVGVGEEPMVARTYYVDGPAAERVAARARAAREVAGTLTGHALGDQDRQEPAPDLLADVRAVFASVGGDRLWHSELLDRLVELRPHVYGGWDVRRLGEELRARGVPTAQVALPDGDGGRVNRRGVRFGDLEAALTGGPDRPEIGP